MPPRKCSKAGGRTPGQRTRGPPEQTAQRRAPATTKIGAENDCECDPGGRDRDAVDVASAPVGQRVAQPPPLCLEWRERPPDLVLRARADTAAPGQAHPAASVDHQPGGDEHKYPRHSGGAGDRGPDGEGARRQACGSAGDCAAQAPVLLAAGIAGWRHGQKLASAPDEWSPGRGRDEDDHACRPPMRFLPCYRLRADAGPSVAGPEGLAAWRCLDARRFVSDRSRGGRAGRAGAFGYGTLASWRSTWSRKRFTTARSWSPCRYTPEGPTAPR
jgi:hypothetical protein